MCQEKVVKNDSSKRENTQKLHLLHVWEKVELYIVLGGKVFHLLIGTADNMLH